MEDFGAGGVAEAPQGGEEAEEAGVAAEEDLEEGRRCWLNHTDMKVHVSSFLFFSKIIYGKQLCFPIHLRLGFGFLSFI